VEVGLIRRIISALLVSAVFSAVVLAVDFGINPTQEGLSKAQTAAVALLTPAEFLTEQSAPGHSGVQIVVLAVWTLALYTVLAWVALSLGAWWRSRSKQVLENIRH